MTESILKGADRSKLRGLAMRRKDDASVGRGGLSESLVENIKSLLQQEQLIKVRILHADREERRRLLEALAEQTESEIVGQTGKTGLIYRRNPDRPSLLK